MSISQVHQKRTKWYGYCSKCQDIEEVEIAPPSRLRKSVKYTCVACKRRKAKETWDKVAKRIRRPRKTAAAILKVHDGELRKISLPEAVKAARVEWSRVVRERARSRCEICGVYCPPGKMQRGNGKGQANHIISAGKGGWLVIWQGNGLYECSDCHCDFHGGYGNAGTGNQGPTWAALLRLRPDDFEKLSDPAWVRGLPKLNVGAARDQLEHLRNIRYEREEEAA